MTRSDDDDDGTLPEMMRLAPSRSMREVALRSARLLAVIRMSFPIERPMTVPGSRRSGRCRGGGG